MILAIFAWYSIPIQGKSADADLKDQECGLMSDDDDQTLRRLQGVTTLCTYINPWNFPTSYAHA